MAENTSVSIGFNTKEAQQEIKALTSAMKQTQNEFKITDTTLKTTGSTLDILNNKYKSLSNQMKQQSEITSKCEQGVKKYSQAQENARQRLEKANTAYEKGKSAVKGNKDELQKLKDEVQKAQKAVKTADSQYEKWNNKLSQSKLAEANLRNELNQTSEALKKQSSYIAQVQDKYKQLDAKTAGLQKGLTKGGKALTATATAPIIAGAALAVKAFNEVDDGADIVIEKTGATGKAAKELEGVYKQVAKTIPAEFTDIGSAVGEINTRLEFTDKKLQTASEDFLKFARINKTDVNTAVQLVTRAMGDASIPAEQYNIVLDALTVASQKSGISIDKLTTNLAKYGAPMRALGLDISDSIALFAAWEKSGVNTEIAFSGMKKAISNWGKEGKDSRVEFAKTLQDIKSAPDIAAATTKAIEVFGAKAGPDLADAIKGGRFEVSAYMEALENADGTVNNTYNEIVDGSDDAKLAAQQLKIAMAEIGETIMTSVGPTLLSLADDTTAIIEKFGDLDEGTQKTILKLLLIAATAGPLLSLGAKGVKVVNGGIAIFSKLNGVLGSTATAGEAAAAGAATTGEAVTVAGEAAATAAGARGIGAFLGALGAVGGASAGIAAAATAPFAATYAVAKIASNAIDNYHQKLGQSGAEALHQAQEYRDKVKTAYDLSKEAETVQKYYDKYSELDALRQKENLTTAEEKELQAIEQWFIDNYGAYISAEEQKNGVHKTTLDFIRQITQAQKERAEAEKEALRDNIAKEHIKKYENSEKSKSEIPKLQTSNNNMRKQIQEAESLKQSLSTLQNKYKAIDSTLNGEERRKAVHQLTEDNKEILESYAKLTGGQLTLPELEEAIKNLMGKTDEWSAAVKSNEERIKNHQQSISDYKASLITNQDTVTQEVLKSVDASSITELFSGGDSAKIQKALIGITEQCKLLGMSTNETALQVGLFKNGFSNLGEAMSKGDKAMSAVVADMNRYIHTVVGLPDNIEITVNADGDISFIDKAEKGIKDINGKTAEAKVKVDGSDSEQTVINLQELIDKYGAVKAVALLQADDKATVTINGVTYKLSEYSTKTGIATLKAENGDAIITIDTTTGAVQGFGNVEGTAMLKIDSKPAMTALEKAVSSVKNSWSSGFTAPLKTRVEKGSAFLGLTGEFAKGTDSAPGGPAIINDEKGIADNRELVEHKGKYYLFEGKNILLNLDKRDKVFTAKQTKEILKNIPHYATGTNNASFTAAKDDFEYRQKTSVVSESEALVWWKNVLEQYAFDADVVKEANIEIYELTKKINDNAIKDYKNRIKKQESTSKSWIDYEVKMHNLSIDEQIAAYGRMDDNYRKTLTEMTENTTMTAEELEEVWGEYYDTIRDHEIKIAELRKKNLEEQHKQSLKYIEERTYYNDWENHNDTPEDVYARIKERNDTELLAGHITDEEYNDNMTEAGQKLYEGRLKNSKKWLEMQKKYGAITEEEYREGLARIKAYTEDYYRRGMISGQFYYDALDDANSDLFDNMQSSLENYLNEYYEAQKEMLSARRAEIEAEYDALEKSEKKADRLQELKDLQSQYAKYQNAVTIEGKKKLKEIQDNIDGLKKEERDEIRNEEKQSRLDELNKESESIEKEQENSLKGISKYTAQALGIISGGNDEMIVKFNKIVENYNSQQATLAQSGYDTISKIVDMTNVKLAELGQNLQPQQSGGGDVKVSVTQTFHNQITDDVSAQAYGKFASRSVNNLNWLEMFNKNGGMK